MPISRAGDTFKFYNDFIIMYLLSSLYLSSFSVRFLLRNSIPVISPLVSCPWFCPFVLSGSRRCPGELLYLVLCLRHIETITIRRDTQLCASTKTCVLRGFYISLLASSQQHKADERRHDQLVAGCQASADTWDNDP